MTASLESTVTTDASGAPPPRPEPTRPVTAGRVGAWVLLTIGAIAALAPFLWLVRSAFMTNEQMFAFPPELVPSPVAWANFSGAVTTQPFGLFFLNTLVLELIVVPGVLLSTSLAAFALGRLRWPGRGVVFALLMSALLLPGAATLIPTFILWKELGALNTYFPLTVPAILGVGGAFNIFLMRQFFMTIPTDLDDAAYLDGASPWYVYGRIILPLAKPALILVGVFTFMATWNDLFNPLIYLSDSSKFTLALGLASFQSVYDTEWGYLMAASLIVVAPVIAVFFVAQRYILEGVVLSGMKG